MDESGAIARSCLVKLVPFAIVTCACSAPSTKPPAAPAVIPALHGAAVHGPFATESELCRAVYASDAGCLRPGSERVAGPIEAGAGGFGRIQIVEAGLYDDRCALVFQIADRWYVHDQPGLCTSVGHSLYLPTVREIGFRDLDGTSPRELVIIADIEIARDEVEGAPARTDAPAPIAMAIVCGQRGGGTPSCVEATTSAPDEFVATHAFRF